jgi:diaminohydroxyphosphoribosylaminopyrimidine deaminase/5-amino-6-(5-phosphoribosylamino)uracil reductase
MEDPNPQVGGRGLARCVLPASRPNDGLLADEARELNIGFVSRMTRGRPWLRLKLAAASTARRPEQRRQPVDHRPRGAPPTATAWRARACAILTGIGTVRDDDPRSPCATS